MYVSDKFVYTELHKTAGTHIGKWLSRLAPGKQVGKHNVIPPDLRDRFVIGSIRNPWDWYVSLWAYGCERRGSVWHQTTSGVDFGYYWQQLPSEMGQKKLSLPELARQLKNDFAKNNDEWIAAYEDIASPECFQRWLALIFDTNRRFDIREGYGFSPIALDSGIMSYRFLKFFTGLDQRLYSQAYFAANPNLLEVWNKERIANYLIRMEHLEEDLIEAMELAGVSIEDEQKRALVLAREQKTNTSSRLPAKLYYDQESIALIYQKERLLVDTFGYSPPR